MFNNVCSTISGPQPGTIRADNVVNSIVNLLVGDNFYQPFKVMLGMFDSKVNIGLPHYRLPSSTSRSRTIRNRQGRQRRNLAHPDGSVN